MGVVYRSKIAEVLRARQLPVSELRRRLEDKGTHVSRGALDHLVSDRPVKQIDLRILWPLLDELDLDMRSAFVTTTEDDRPSQEQRTAAMRLARQLANTRAADRARAIREGEREQSEIIARLTEKVRKEHPEVFDRRGRLRKRALARLLVSQLGKAALTDEDLLRMQDRAFPAVSLCAAPQAL